MNRIDELIKKLCPNGVEYKKASEIKIESFWLMPSTPTYIAEGVPYITSKNIKNGKINFENVNYISEKDYLSISGNRTIKKNDLLITMIGTIGETAFVEEDIKFYGQNMYLIRLNEKVINRKFFNYYLTSEKIKNSLVSRKNTSSQGYIKAGSIENLLLPVPPLEVQCEIVHILDDFTLLSAELSAELKARQKQYQFYLNNLLDIEKLKPQKIMYVKDLFEIKNGLNKEKGAFGKGTPIVNFTDVYKNRYLTKNMLKGKVTLNEREIKRYAVEKGDVFFTRTSETKEDIGMSSTVIEDIEKCTFSGFVLRARPTTDLLIPKFCAYYFSTNKVRDTIIRYASFTTRATTSGPKLAKIPVPIISIKEQEKIVNILDRFDKLCNDISEGLPAEIEARQKQYEYYRDKLLTFKELKVNE